jgi:dolichol-phosphate mannosyltransferase
MTSRPHLYLVVPLLNEVANLPRLFEAFGATAAEHADALQVEVVVVDDGSTDGTGRVARELAGALDVVVLAHPINRGPGQAFGTAFEHLAPHLTEHDYVVTLEGDNTSRQELLRQMLHRAQEGHDVVLASPYMYGGGLANTNATRVMISHVANAFVKEFLGIHGILTMSSFFRLYRGHAIQRLQLHYGPRIVERAGFESMVEMLLKMTYLQMRISEVPMVLDTGLRSGKSTMKIGRTALGYLALFMRKGAWRARAGEPSPVRDAPGDLAMETRAR